MLCLVAEVPPGQGKACEVGARQIAVFNLGGEFLAIDNMCPHDGGPLAEGELRGCSVTCPWHGAEFDVRTGAVLTPPATENVRAYPVIVRDGRLEIEL